VTARKLLSAAIMLVLLCVPTGLCVTAGAQDGQPRFGDLAARAAQARDAGNLAQAVDLYRQATAAKPDWQEGWWYLGSLEYAANQYQPAIDAFTHLLQLAPQAVPPMALRGLCAFEIGAYNDALRDLEQAVAHGAADDPRNAQILRFHLAQLLTRAGRFQDALSQYAFFQKAMVEDADIDAGIGMAGLRAASLLNETQAQDRVLYEAAGHAGYPLLGQDSVEAERRFRELFAKYPSTRNLHYFYGFLLFPSAPEMAAVEFQRELVVAPDNTPARAMLAYSLMIMGRYAESRTEAERVLSEEPGMEMAQLALGRALVESGEYARGEEILKQVLAGDPQNKEARLGLISIYSHTGRKEDARRERLAMVK
jgi:tetratricopeptide (TPR) repeat protein